MIIPLILRLRILTGPLLGVGQCLGVGRASEFCFQEVNRLPSGHALRGYVVPTPFDHVPHTIRNFAVVRPWRPSSIQHRVRCCNLGHLMEWGSPRENLS